MKSLLYNDCYVHGLLHLEQTRAEAKRGWPLEERYHSYHSAEVHQLFHAVVRRFESLAELLQRRRCLCCVSGSF
jgi:hypothetical protein